MRSRCALLLLAALAAACWPGGGGSLSGLYADNGLDQTVIQRAMSRAEKRQVEREILSLLGLPRRPRAAAPQLLHSAAPRFMLDVYQSLLEPRATRSSRSEFRLSGQELSAIDTSDAIMSFISQRQHGVRHERGRLLSFDVSEVPLQERILGAELRVFQQARAAPAASFSLTAYQLVGDDKMEHLSYLDSVNSTTTTEGWLSLNVTSAFIDWVVFPDTNKGLYLSPQLDSRPGHEIHLEDIGIISSDSEEDKLPFMVAFLKASGNRDVHTRSARQALGRKRKSENSHVQSNPFTDTIPHWTSRNCQLRTLYVNFQDLDWKDWIIAPNGYHAWYCSGECNFPLNAHMNATNHAIVQTLVHLMYPTHVPKPCCAPVKLGPVHVLYYLDKLVTLNKYKNMVVKSCGCH
ncbi:protein 60A-like [Schistocerca piceifrons]|uniref:protein 60A-like n=1 Tax=Schistocerca piceifrons TaxID=274613 RepID=UPI001F5E6352|nr:protein 60A-like [Schistocerca piceifrons]XP_049812129.1 protein 60A [Schistocerca nitens]XP_049960958.1 protein 60A isoform X2 [Schistocerca serialis cubense]